MAAPGWVAAPQSQKSKGRELLRAAGAGRIAEILQLWKENGDLLDVEWKDTLGRTSLHMASMKGQFQACRVLVSTCGANIDSRNHLGSTPLIVAALNTKTKCVEVLLELGADVTLQGTIENKTALDVATEKGHVKVMDLLAAAGAGPMVKSAAKV